MAGSCSLATASVAASAVACPPSSALQTRVRLCAYACVSSFSALIAIIENEKTYIGTEEVRASRVRAQMGTCVSCASRCLEPCVVPCLVALMTRCDKRVLWRASRRSGKRHVALTIDDLPLVLKAEDHEILNDLFDFLNEPAYKNVGFTLFVMVDGAHELSRGGCESNANSIACKISTLNHQTESNNRFRIGIHRKGRWGWSVDDDALVDEAKTVIKHVCAVGLPCPRYARMPGGFSRPKTVQALKEELNLTVVNGTAYPFDADLCECLSPSKLGYGAARMAVRDGQIAILHYDEHIVAKVRAFLEERGRQGRLGVVTLDALFENERLLRGDCPPLLSLPQ